VYLTVGWLVFVWLLGPFIAAHTVNLPGFYKDQTSSSFLFLYLSCLAYATLINFIQHIRGNVVSHPMAFVESAIIGMLIACMTDFYWYATSNFYHSFWVVLADIGGAAISVGVLGLSTQVARKNGLFWLSTKGKD
jgi:hypothetical protein